MENAHVTEVVSEKIDVEALKASGDIVECADCGELSAYSWRYVAEKEHYFRLGFEKGEIANVGAASCFEWDCGHCGANNVPEDSPLLAEVFTHVSQEQRDATRAY
jgi:hypothetical protein